MPKRHITALLFLGALAAAVTPGFTSHAAVDPEQSGESSESVQDSIQESIQEPLVEERPPPPEPPYPGSEEGSFAADPSILNAPQTAEAPEPPLPRPIKVDENENYYYGTEVAPPKFSATPGVDAPVDTKSSGEYRYDSNPQPPSYKGAPGVERPVEMHSSGAFQYKLPVSVSKHAASFSFGLLTPPKLSNASNSLTFGQIYGQSSLPILLLSYELMRLNTAVGRIGVVIGSGLAVASAQGHFKDPTRAAEVPDERYTFALFPNTVTAHYRFQFSDKQIFVPFINGGAGYYTVAEIRDDGARPRLGGGAVAVGGGGVHLLMDWADIRSLRRLESEYGINHVWFTLEGRGAVTLGSALDFTSASGNAGFMMEF